MQIRKFGISFQRIDHIFISHMHGDHYFGLVGLLSTMHLMGRVKPIRIYGPVGLEQIIVMQLEISKGRLDFEIIFTEIPSGTSTVLFEDDKVSVSCFPLVHKIPTSGFLIAEKPRPRKLLIEAAQRGHIKIEHYHKLKEGVDVEQDGKKISHLDYTEAPLPPKKYAYCSDTAYADTTVEAVRGVDFLYHEATFIESLRDRAKATKHSTAKDAATVAQKAGVGQLLLGHLSARYDSGVEHVQEAAEIFPNVRCVEDGDVIALG